MVRVWMNYLISLYINTLRVFIMLFQFGWAACQVCHLALVPELTTNIRGSLLFYISILIIAYPFFLLFRHSNCSQFSSLCLHCYLWAYTIITSVKHSQLPVLMILANLTVFILVYLLLQTGMTGPSEGSQFVTRHIHIVVTFLGGHASSELGPEDADEFSHLSFIVIAVGMLDLSFLEASLLWRF